MFCSYSSVSRWYSMLQNTILGKVQESWGHTGTPSLYKAYRKIVAPTWHVSRPTVPWLEVRSHILSLGPCLVWPTVKNPPANVIYDPVKRNTAQHLEGWISGPSAATIFHDYQAIPGGIIKHLILPHFPVCLCRALFYTLCGGSQFKALSGGDIFFKNPKWARVTRSSHVLVIKTGSWPNSGLLSFCFSANS